LAAAFDAAPGKRRTVSAAILPGWNDIEFFCWRPSGQKHT
jgi:hypothetical protein